MSPIHAPDTLDSQDTPQTSFRHPTGTNKTPLDTYLAPSGGASKIFLKKTPLGSEYPYGVSKLIKFEVSGVCPVKMSGGCLEGV